MPSLQKTNYRQFLDVYKKGVAEIDLLKADLPHFPTLSDDEEMKMREVVEDELDRLKLTLYGQVLNDEGNLREVLTDIEAGLGDWLDKMQHNSVAQSNSGQPAEVWVTTECYEIPPQQLSHLREC